MEPIREPSKPECVSVMRGPGFVSLLRTTHCRTEEDGSGNQVQLNISWPAKIRLVLRHDGRVGLRAGLLKLHIFEYGFTLLVSRRLNMARSVLDLIHLGFGHLVVKSRGVTPEAMKR